GSVLGAGGSIRSDAAGRRRAPPDRSPAIERVPTGGLGDGAAITRLTRGAAGSAWGPAGAGPVRRGVHGERSRRFAVTSQETFKLRKLAMNWSGKKRLPPTAIGFTVWGAPPPASDAASGVTRISRPPRRTTYPSPVAATSAPNSDASSIGTAKP